MVDPRKDTSWRNLRRPITVSLIFIFFLCLYKTDLVSLLKYIYSTDLIINLNIRLALILINISYFSPLKI